MIKKISILFYILFTSALFAEDLPNPDDVVNFTKTTLRRDLGLDNITYSDSSYEKKRIEFEQKLFEFKSALKNKRCNEDRFKDQKLCKKSELALVKEKEFNICNVKADQVWFQSSLSKDNLEVIERKMKDPKSTIERLKIWETKNDCSAVLTEEHKKLAAYLDSLKEGPNYEPDTCEWVSDLPRKVVNLPGCRDNKNNNICTGYVSCNQKEKFGSGKFIRLATCQKKYCVDGEAKAQDCVKQEGFSSYAATDDSEKMSVSDFMMSELQD